MWKYFSNTGSVPGQLVSLWAQRRHLFRTQLSYTFFGGFDGYTVH